MTDKISIPVEADFSGFSTALTELQTETRRFGNAFSSTIRSAIVNGRSFEDTLKSLALRISSIALSSALKPIGKFAGDAIGSLFSSLGGTFSGSGPQPIPFARGGVIASPTFFETSGQLGVAGEAGPEAILPLARGGDGRLGVRMNEGGTPVSVTFNVSTPDVAGFRKSQAQLSSLLARTVSRGSRTL